MRTILLITLISLFSTLYIFGQTAEDAIDLLENQQGFGLRATALGNAYTAISDDYSGIYYNPAGLARIKTGQFSASISKFNRQIDADFLGSSFSTDISSTKFQSLGLVFPFPVVRGSFVIALGYQKIKDYDYYLKINGFREKSNNLYFLIENDYGESYFYGFDSTLSQRSNIETEGNLSQWSFGLAWDFAPYGSMGFSLDVYDGFRNDNFEYAQDTVNSVNNWYMDDTPSPAELQFVYYDFQRNIESDFSGFQLKAGTVFDFIPRHLKMGIMITFPMKFKVDEEWSVSDDLAYDIIRSDGNDVEMINAPITESYISDYAIKLPFKFNIGIALDVSNFLLSVSADARDWSQIKYEIPDNISAADEKFLSDQNRRFKDEFQTVYTYAIGGELRLLESKLKLRAGYRNVPSPIKELGSNYDKQYISTGLGYQVDKSTIIHLTYVRGSWKNNGNYYYDFFVDDPAVPLETREDYVSSKILFGAQFSFK